MFSDVFFQKFTCNITLVKIAEIASPERRNAAEISAGRRPGRQPLPSDWMSNTVSRTCSTCRTISGSVCISFFTFGKCRIHAVDPRCAFAVVLRYTSRVARLLHTAVSGDGLYKAVLEPKFDLTLARMASERSLRTFVVWPPVVHLQRDDDDTPTDGYGGNSSRFIEAYLGMDER